ncbi:MAG TPA: tetratricopeptide repeat protein [Vicinamibacterales bacterium]|nr:tetratricopeptide repeat protein [Vicinamibacterales bacterium]
MKSLRTVGALVIALALANAVFAQSKGNLRITGRVLDESGQPVAEAQVRAAKRGEAQPQIFSTKTNDKGEYTINGIAAGDWVLEASKEGVGTIETTATLADGEKTKTVDITIRKPVDPNAELQSEHQRALQLAQGGNIPEARKIYDALIAKYPQVYQLHAMQANMYAAEGNAPKGLEHLKIALEKEPDNTDWLVLQAELLMETGDKESAARILQGIELSKVKDHRAFTNLAIHWINDKKTDEAIELLTKMIAQFPSDAALVYYRGRGYIAAGKLPEAKADLEKFVATAPPDAPQLADAKKLIEEINKAK